MCEKCGGEKQIHGLWVNLKETHHLEVADLRKDTIEQILTNLRKGRLGQHSSFENTVLIFFCGEILD